MPETTEVGSPARAMASRWSRNQDYMVEDAYEMDDEEWPEEAHDDASNWEQWDDEAYA